MSAFIAGLFYFVVMLYPKLGGWVVEALKSSAIVIAGALIAVLFARRSAVARCAVMRATVVALLATAAWHVAPPAFEALRPKVPLPLPRANPQVAFQAAVSAGVARSNEEAKQAADIRHDQMLRSKPYSAPVAFEDQTGVAAEDYQTQHFAWLDTNVTAFWLGGFALLIAWRVMRVVIGIRWLRRGTQTVPAAIIEAARRMGDSLGLTRPVECRMGKGIASPLVTGWRRACLWLPEVCNEWPEDQLRTVLHHELAHVMRRDAIWQSLGSLASAFWWWNPLVWWLVRRLRSEAEFAADEIVLCGRTSGADYAETLVRVASTVGTAPCVSAGLPMIGRSPIEQRVRAILAENPFRGRAGWMGATGAAVVLVGGLLAAALAAQNNSAQAGAQAQAIKLPEEQRLLAERAARALATRRDRLRYLHFKLEESWTDWNEKGELLKSSPMPTKAEVWTDEQTGLHRAVYTPSVMRWSNGAAPAYIENRTDINDGKKQYEISERGGREDMHSKDKPDGLQRLLGVVHEQDAMRKLASIATSGRAGIKGYFKISVLESEHEGRKVIELREEALRGDKESDVSHREVWLLDPAADYAVVVHKNEFPQNGSIRLWQVEEMGRSSEGDFFPRRYSFSDLSKSVRKSEDKTTVTLFEPLKKLPDGILDLPKSDKDRFVAKNGAAKQPDHIDIKIVDAQTGKPMPGTKVDFDLNDAKRQHLTADGDGIARIPLPKDEVKLLSVWGMQKAYTMQLVRWRKYHEPLQLSESYELKLYPASPIEGRVLTEQGQPIEDAVVEVNHTGRQKSWSTFSDRHDLWSVEAKTDAAGNWTMNGFPDDLAGLSIRVSHPDYRATTDLGSSDYRMLTGQDYNSLRDGTSVIKLADGEALAGKVVDESGKPVINARVAIGRDMHGANLPQGQTDADGLFRFKGLNTDETWISVEPKEHQPVARRIKLPWKDTSPLVLKTKEGRIVRGRVVREDGTPCKECSVLVDRWRELRTLTFETKTDKDGRFEWRAAPEDAVTFYFGVGQGREFLGDLPLKPSDAEQLIVLKPALRLQGTVVDARTQKPVAKFRVTPGHDGGGGSIYWDQANAMMGIDGHFEWEAAYMQRGGNEPMFLIEAEGYAPFQSQTFPTRQQTEKPVFQLTTKR